MREQSFNKIRTVLTFLGTLHQMTLGTEIQG